MAQAALNKMIVLAAEKFDGKFDKGGVPYILHCLKVMHYLKSDDEDLNCIAVGHDLVEDTNVTFKQLAELGFNERVIDGIRRLTKMPGETEEEQLMKILTSLDACRVKLADLRHNSDIRRLKGITEKDVARIRKYHHWYTQITQVLQATGHA